MRVFIVILSLLALPLGVPLAIAADPPIEIRRAIIPTSPIVTKSVDPEPRAVPGAIAADPPIEIRRAIIPASSIVTMSVDSEPHAATSLPVPGDVPAITPLPTNVPPIIDGRLDDVGWQGAPVISDFTQVEPNQGAAPTERTEVRIVYNRDFLFIGVRCYDREPDKIVAKQMQRDADLESDDHVAFAIDSFAGKRSGYLFMISPGGAIRDTLIEADGTTKFEWDAIWTGETHIDAEGWTAEIAIPFKSISFDAKAPVWGWNVERVIRRKQEVVRWATPYRNRSLTGLANLGQLRDLSGIRQGLGIEIKPFAVLRHTEAEGTIGKALEFEPGFDLFYSITPSLTASLTYNTDFAEAEVDTRQINLSRFPIFFPEKRDFFLQDANLFSFNPYEGPIGFNSRRIGLGPRGEVIDLMYGGKLTGRIGNLDIGLLNTQMDETVGVPQKSLTVGRMSYRILEESSVGGIFTYGDPHSANDNSLIGTDLNYRTSNLFDNKRFTAQSWAMISDTPGATEGEMAFGGSVRYPNEPFAAEVHAVQVDADFNPALGFIRRRAYRQYGGELAYRWRPDGGYIRSWGVQAKPLYVTNLENEIETEWVTLPGIDFVNEAGDALGMGLTFHRENFDAGYEIYPGVFVPGADYRYKRIYGTLASTPARALSAHCSVDFGEFFDGTSREFGLGADWRASAHVYVGAYGSLNQVDLPAGSFDAAVGSANINFAFTPNISWNTLVQYDNLSETVGVNSRFKWIVHPGSIIFVVFNYGFDAMDSFRTVSKEFATKVVWSIRF